MQKSGDEFHHKHVIVAERKNECVRKYSAIFKCRCQWSLTKHFDPSLAARRSPTIRRSIHDGMLLESLLEP